MRVHPQRGLVQEPVAGRVAVAVVELGFGRDADVLVGRAKELRFRRGEETPVGENDGDARVEDARGEERGGGVGQPPRAEDGVRGDDGDVEGCGEGDDGLALRGGGGGGVPRVVGDAEGGGGGAEEGFVKGEGAEVRELLRDEVGWGGGDVVEGVGPEDARARVDAGEEAGFGGCVGPGVVCVVEDGGDAAVERFVDAGELADVDVFRGEEAGGGEFAVAAEVLEEGGVAGERLEGGLPAVLVGVDAGGGQFGPGTDVMSGMSYKPGVMILPLASTTSVSLRRRFAEGAPADTLTMRSSLMSSEPSRITSRAFLLRLKATIVPPLNRIDEASASSGAARRGSEVRIMIRRSQQG